jgi:hypothetical protein
MFDLIAKLRESSKGTKDTSTVGRIARVVSSVLLGFFVLLFILVVIARISGNGFFGYSLHYIVTASMSPEYDVGDVVFVKRLAKFEIKELFEKDEDVDILFFNPNLAEQRQGITYKIHRIRSVNVSPTGIITFNTYGINAQSDDREPAVDVLGVAVGKSAFLGILLDIKNLAYLIFAVVLMYFVFMAILRAAGIIRVETTGTESARGEVASSGNDSGKGTDMNEIMLEVLAILRSEQAAGGITKSNGTKGVEAKQTRAKGGTESDAKIETETDINTKSEASRHTENNARSAKGATEEVRAEDRKSDENEAERSAEAEAEAKRLAEIKAKRQAKNKARKAKRKVNNKARK